MALEDFLGNLFPQAPSYLPGLLGEEQARLAQQQARQQGLLGIGLGLLGAAGPSRTPSTLGQTLAQGMAQGQQAYQNVYQQRVQEQMVAQQIADMQQKQRQRQAFESALGGTGGAFAELEPGQRAVAALLGPEAGAKYLGEQLTPKFATSPQTLMVNGRPASVLFSSTGAMRVLEAQPLPNEEKVDLGNQIAFRDKNTGVITGTVNKTMTPGEAARLQFDIGVEARQAGQPQIMPSGTGYVAIPKAPGAVAQPVLGPTGEPIPGPEKPEKPTEGNLTAAGFLGVMRQASSILDQPLLGKDNKPLVDKTGNAITAEQFYAQPNFAQAVAQIAPFVGDASRSMLSSENRQRVLQAQEAWVRAKLRKESGAAIGKDEMEKEIKTFFPQYGDEPATIAQKMALRRQAEQGLAVQAGPALSQVPGVVESPQMQTGTGPRRLVYNPQTGRIEEAK